MFKIEIETSNDAFGVSVTDELGELARILRDTADRLEDGQESGRLRDANGNTVGWFQNGDAR